MARCLPAARVRAVRGAARRWPTDAAAQDALFARLRARSAACALFASACARARATLLGVRAALPPHMLEFALFHQRLAATP